MNLDLSDEEVAALRALLANHISDMYAEISHTDNPIFRQELRDERGVLRSIHQKLALLPTHSADSSWSDRGRSFPALSDHAT